VEKKEHLQPKSESEDRGLLQENITRTSRGIGREHRRGGGWGVLGFGKQGNSVFEGGKSKKFKRRGSTDPPLGRDRRTPARKSMSEKGVLEHILFLK